MDYFNHESERLTFRKLSESDIDSWLEFFENNNTLHFLGMDPSREHRDLATEWVQMQINRYAKNGLGHLAVVEKSTNTLIGFSGIILRELDGKTYYEIGYTFKPSSWGKGFASEASKHLKTVGLATKISNEFVSIIHLANIASMKVAEKNGMSRLFDTTFMNMEVAVFGDE